MKSPDDIGREVAQTIRSWPHVTIPDGRPLGRVIADEIRAAAEAARAEEREENCKAVCRFCADGDVPFTALEAGYRDWYHKIDDDYRPCEAAAIRARGER